LLSGTDLQDQLFRPLYIFFRRQHKVNKLTLTWYFNGFYSNWRFYLFFNSIFLTKQIFYSLNFLKLILLPAQQTVRQLGKIVFFNKLLGFFQKLSFISLYTSGYFNLNYRLFTFTNEMIELFEFFNARIKFNFLFLIPGQAFGFLKNKKKRRLKKKLKRRIVLTSANNYF
jgi:hypothetical protein